MPVGNSQKGYEAISIKPLHIKQQPRLYFNSIITEYSDSWTPQWSATNVYGRMDPVATYGGTSRELTLSFRVISDSVAEARENMIKIEKLIQYQYPTYQTATGGTKIMNSPPYFELTFLNLLKSNKKQGSKLTGYINGAIQINPGFQTKEQAQFFSPGFDKIFFSDVTISLRLQVLHQGAIGWTNSSFSHKSYPYNVDLGSTLNPDDATNPSAPGTPAEQADGEKGSDTNAKPSAAATDGELTQAQRDAATRKKQLERIQKAKSSVAAAAERAQKDLDILKAQAEGFFDKKTSGQKAGAKAAAALKAKRAKEKQNAGKK